MLGLPFSISWDCVAVFGILWETERGVKQNIRLCGAEYKWIYCGRVLVFWSGLVFIPRFEIPGCVTMTVQVGNEKQGFYSDPDGRRW